MIRPLRMRKVAQPSRRGGGSGRRVTAMVCVLAVGPLLFLSAGAMTSAGASSGVSLVGRINGQPLSTSSESNPVRLYPLRPANIVVTVHNETSSSVHVATVRLSGEVIGLTFFAFDNSVAFTVPPYHSVTNRYSIPLVGLNGQATGLIDGSLSVLNPVQQVVASQGLVADVRGSLASVYGVFGLAVALLTVLAFALVLLELARHGLPANRFRRGLYFVVPGLGLGLVLVFTLSATRVFVPSVGHWVPLVIVSAIIFFVVGFLTPDPRIEEDDDVLVETLAASRTVVLPTTATAPQHAARTSPLQGEPGADAATPEPPTAPTPRRPAAPTRPSHADGAGAGEPGSAPATKGPKPATARDPGGPPAPPAADGAASPGEPRV
jgi:hypothetical protein